MEEEIILVDTDELINLSWDKSNKLAKYLKLQAGGKVKLVISSITIYEYYSGVILENNENREKADYLFSRFYKQPVTEEIAKLASALNRSGRLHEKIGLGDLLIGATALYLGGKLLTSNKKHFKLIPDLVFAK